MKDIDIRKRLKSIDLPTAFPEADTRIVDELEIGYGDSRIDVAVINCSLHGYEIKSNHDTLFRLERQLQEYTKVFDYLTFTVGDKHIDEARKIIPRWCGLIEVKTCKQSECGLAFKTIRIAKPNKKQDAFTLAQFLWKNECIQLLNKKGITKGIASKSRITLWQMVADQYPAKDLSFEVRALLKLRPDWK